MTTTTATRCPRCRGACFRDQYDDLACINCGWTETPALVLDTPKREQRPVLTEAQLEVLAWLRKFPGMSAGKMAIHLEITATAVKMRLDGLYTKGYVRREGAGGLLDPFRWFCREVGE